MTQTRSPAATVGAMARGERGEDVIMGEDSSPKRSKLPAVQ
jgi:hypothetical protein